MKKQVADLAKNLPIYYPIHNFLTRRRYLREYAQWEQSGHPVPPPHLAKQKVLRSIAEEFGYKVLVETGTYYGAMVEALLHEFDAIYTIELSEYLHRLATRRFKSSRHVYVIQGDSATKLPEILAGLACPTLFWLDGHYSAGVTARGAEDTPILQELNHILSGKDLGHSIVIDDARDFGVEPGYPTLEQVTSFVKERLPGHEIRISGDSIQITPKRRG